MSEDQLRSETSLKNEKIGLTKPTELGDVPDDWTATTLAKVSSSEESSFVEGPAGSKLKADEFEDTGYARIIKLQNIGEATFKDKNKKYISKERFKELEHHSADPGDIAIAAMAEPIARACILPSIEQRYILAAMADCIKLRPSAEFNNHYVMYALNSHPVWRQAYSLSIGTARKRINLHELKEVQIPTPSIQEQRHIASVLKNIDNSIEKTGNIIAQLKKVKQGLLRELLRPKDTPKPGGKGEFPKSETPEDWELVQLGEVATQRSENVDPTEVDLKYHIGLEHITPNDPNPDREPIEAVTSTKRRFYPDDILFAKLRPNLEKAAQPDFEGVCSTDIITVKANNARIRPDFLLYRLSSKPAFDFARRTSAGTRMPRTSWSLFKKFTFPLPPKHQQQEIARQLQDIDNSIYKERGYQNQLNKLKKGIKQDLLSGEVRTHNKDIEIIDEVLHHG